MQIYFATGDIQYFWYCRSPIGDGVFDDCKVSLCFMACAQEAICFLLKKDAGCKPCRPYFFRRYRETFLYA